MSGWATETHPELASTQALLLARAAAGAPDRTAILAQRQTAGRGQQGREWQSPPGNLHLSVLLRPAGVARDAPLWGLLGAVALAEAARATDPDPAAIALKWPNDLMRGGAKAGGVLAETALAGAAIDWVVLGFGVNLAHAPALERSTACLPGAIPPADFATRLLARLDHWRGIVAAAGFAPLLAAWAVLGPPPGAPLTVRAGAAWHTGHFAGLAADGSLCLRTATGTLRITSGEIAQDGAG